MSEHVEKMPALPQQGAQDYARTVGEALVAAIPFVGGSLTVLIDGILKPSHERRLESWLENLSEVVSALQCDAYRFDQLLFAPDNETFVSSVHRATQIAMSTSIEGKIELLKSALLSVGLGLVSDEFLAVRMISLVDELSVEHLQLIRYAAQPAKFHRTDARPPIAATPRSMIASTFGGLSTEIVDLLLHDLGSRGLLKLSGLTVASKEYLEPFATPLGLEFLSFVSL
jgi:hypothetical protein